MGDYTSKTGLSLGCGLIYQSNRFWHVDIRQTPIVDQVVDLNVYPWPFANNTFELVVAHDIVEHVDDAIHFMEECWRIMRPEAMIYLRGPYHGHSQAYRAMDHKRYLALDSMDLFIRDTEYWRGYHYYSPVRFDKLKADYFGAEIVWELRKAMTDDGRWELP